MVPVLLGMVLLCAAPDGVTAVDVSWRGGEDDFGATGVGFTLGDEDVWLGVVVHYSDGTCATAEGVYRDVHGADHVCARPLNALQDWRAEFFRLRPTQARVKRSPRGEGEPVRFAREVFATVRGDKGVLATFHSDDAEPLGVMRFGVTLTDADGATITSPAEDAPRNALRVVVRLDDGFLGVLWELAGVAVVDGPRGVPPAAHETEQHLGMDANSAVVYAARRLGMPLAYVDVVDQPGLVVMPAAQTVPRRGDLLVKGAADVSVLMAPSLATDAPVLAVTAEGLRIAQVGKLPPGSTVRRWVDLPRKLAVIPPRKLTKAVGAAPVGAER